MNKRYWLMTCMACCLTFGAAAAEAQSSNPFARDYDRDVYCAAASILGGQSSAGAPDPKAINYWLSATTAEGTRLGFTAEQNRQAVEKKVGELQGSIAKGQEGQVRDTYRKNCNAN